LASADENPVRLIPLGGLGEFGLNAFVLAWSEHLLLLDAGLMFPGAEMPGVDSIVPDFQFLEERREQLRGIVLTHGHEDHIGAIQYLMRDGDGIGDLRDDPLPVYGSALSLGLARNRIDEAGLMPKIDMRPVRDGEQIDVGSLLIEFIPVTHSVPHAHAIAVHTAQGVVLHSGDFKLDMTPVDERRADLARIGQLAKNEGIRLLMSDSTNAEEPGYAPSETNVGGVLRGLFAQQRGRRIITASFASHIHRIQQIADAAVEEGRKVATLGLSMKKNIRLGLDLGVFRIPESSLIDIEDIGRYDPGDICIISTGSQGEPMSALGLMARGENRWLKLNDQDTVVLSSHAIPGNEGNVNKVMDGLLRLGANVVHSGVMDVHATGHAQADDIKTYLSIVNPEWFVPIHGEYRHMVANAELGELMGVRGDRIIRCEDGDVLQLDRDGLVPVGRVPSGYLYVDGIVGDVGKGVLRDRRKLAEEGVVVVVSTVDMQTGKVLVDPEIITRGWVYAPEAEDLLDEACDTVAAALEKALAEGVRDVEQLEREARRATGKFVSERTKRRPMIVPVVMEA
jgi:ribonuclease J